MIPSDRAGVTCGWWRVRRVFEGFYVTKNFHSFIKTFELFKKMNNSFTKPYKLLSRKRLIHKGKTTSNQELPCLIKRRCPHTKKLILFTKKPPQSFPPKKKKRTSVRFLSLLLLLRSGFFIHVKEFPKMSIQISKAPPVHKSVILRIVVLTCSRGKGAMNNLINLFSAS